MRTRISCYNTLLVFAIHTICEVIWKSYKFLTDLSGSSCVSVSFVVPAAHMIGPRGLFDYEVFRVRNGIEL